MNRKLSEDGEMPGTRFGAQGSRRPLGQVLKALQLMAPDEWTLGDVPHIFADPERLGRVLGIAAILDSMASMFWGGDCVMNGSPLDEDAMLAFVRGHPELWEDVVGFGETDWAQAIARWPGR